MKDRLETFIDYHREEFDSFEPSDELWNRIKKNSNKERHFSFSSVIWKAASIILIFGASYAFFVFMNTENKDVATEETLQQEELVIPELIEAEAFYAMQVNQKMQELKVYSTQYPELEKELNYDLAELDSVYCELKKDLKDNVANEEVIEAMIQNYRLKLEILESMLTQLQRTNNNSDSTLNTTENVYEI